MTEKDTVLDLEKFPVDPKMPSTDILLEIFSRITAMSDAIHSPSGSLQTRLQRQEKTADLRNMAQMNILRKILAEILEIKAHLVEVDETIDIHSAKLTLQSNFTEIQ